MHDTPAAARESKSEEEHEMCYHPGCLRPATREVWTLQGNGSALLPFCDHHARRRERAGGRTWSNRA
ncbi:MAG: hypothetical protein DLM53_03130 [Candidatus Eremiobacter antarcticus]|nr:MAG: hypothetical protein DLM53_03130 [Candidatus Eremiobacter sp. RRmetagenome_bin22]